MLKKLAIGAAVIILILGMVTCNGNSAGGALGWIIPLGLLGLGIFLFLKK
jgi:hypothetical protein